MRLARALAAAASPGGGRATLSILIFHRVLPRPDPLFPDLPDAERFDEQLSWLGRLFNLLPMDEAVRALQAATLPARAAAITFDDGYADNYTVALPLLRRHRVPATFFIATAFIDGGRMWNDTVIEAIRRSALDELDLGRLDLGRHPLRSADDRRRAIDRVLSSLKYLPAPKREALADDVAARCGVAQLPRDLMMTSDHVKGLRDAGMGVGGHTCTHPILSHCPDAVAFEEIAEGKARLEDLLKESVSLFAYPNGKPMQDYDARHRDMVRQAGFAAAVTTSIGAARVGADRFQLPRFTPWDRSATRYGLRLVRNMRQQGVMA